MLLIRDAGLPTACGAVDLSHPPHAEIKTLSVSAEARDRGLGLQILQRLLAEAQAQGFAEVRLETVSFMTNAIRLYLSFDFASLQPATRSLPRFNRSRCSWHLPSDVSEDSGPTCCPASLSLPRRLHFAIALHLGAVDRGHGKAEMGSRQNALVACDRDVCVEAATNAFKMAVAEHRANLATAA